MRLAVALAALLGLPLTFVPAGALAAPEPSAAAPVADIARFVERFESQKADRATAMRLQGVTLTRDAARFVLEDGTLWFCPPIEGQVRVALFKGTGSFSVEPPTEFERAELARFCKTTVLERRLETLVLVFADSTYDELRGRGPGAEAPVPGDAAEALSWYLDAVGGWRSSGFDPGMAWPLFNGRRNGFFSAYVMCEGDRPFFLEIDPMEREEVSLLRVAPAAFLTSGSLEKREVVSRFPLGGRYDTTAVGNRRPDVTVGDYRLDCTISSGLEFSAAAELRCRAAVDQVSWIPLDLFEDLAVDSVLWDGAPATFARKRDTSMLWVRPPTPAQRNEDHVLRVVYHGGLLHGVADWIFLNSTTGWYPRTSALGEATFELTFHTPSKLHLRSVGEEVESEKRGGVTHSRWAVRRPSRNATFVIGRFREQPFGTDETPPVTALMYQGKPGKVQWTSGKISMVQGAALEDWVVQDVAKCVAFYQKLLGPAQVPGFVVGQAPALHGEAFPGLINIPQTAFIGETAIAEDQVFRSHEVAHQWWGYSVAKRSYHDHWLEEGFADFTALWYLQSGLRRNREYLAVLEKWRDEIFQDHEVRPEKGRAAGPIWLGYRNASYARPRDYQLVDYTKAAWVLQMLRSMLLDLDTMDDSRFSNLMQEFYRSHAGGAASTADFKRIVEKHAGGDLGWFFDQWVYGTGLPTYRFASKTEPTADGKYLVSCRVEQSGVPAEFRMPVILRVEFGKDQFAWVRRTVTGSVARFDLPPMPMKPTKILFNDVSSVLCKVKNESW